MGEEIWSDNQGGLDTRTPFSVDPVDEPAEAAQQVLVHGMDVSSHQPKNLSGLIQQYQIEHVVVKLYQTIESIPAEHSVAQINSAVVNNCSVGGYVWGYADSDPAKAVREGLAVAEQAGIILPILWLDWETYTDGSFPSADWIRAAISECRKQEIRAGIYSGRWFIEGYIQEDLSDLASIPLWTAQYDYQQNLAFTPYAYWTAILGKQYSADGIDLDVFDKSVTVIE